MSTWNAPDGSPVALDRDPDLDHYVCECAPDWALCGTYVPDDGGWTWLDDLEHPCVVCCDLEPQKCQRCGT